MVPKGLLEGPQVYYFGILTLRKFLNPKLPPGGDPGLPTGYTVIQVVRADTRRRDFQNSHKRIFNRDTAIRLGTPVFFCGFLHVRGILKGIVECRERMPHHLRKRLDL